MAGGWGKRLCTFKRTQQWVGMLVCTSLGILASFLPVSFIVGTHTAFFSASHGFFPLLGWLGGFVGACVLLIGQTCLHVSAGTSLCFLLLACHLPSFCAALYFAPYRIVRLGVPLISMILFIAHPVGLYAFPYTLFWVIPLVVGLCRTPSYFMLALGGTFADHAVGSVLWLYAGRLPYAAQWIGLMPVVCVERLLFAALMTTCMVLYSRFCAPPIPREHTVKTTIHTLSPL